MKKRIALYCACIILAGLWTWRYSTMNDYYDSFRNITEVRYQFGETVPFGTNKTSEGNVLDGYSICVKSLDVLETNAFLDTYGVTEDAFEIIPERIALVMITLRNDGCDESVELTELALHGIDNYVGMNWTALRELNPVLNGSTAIRLDHGTECNIVLPFNIFRQYFGSYTWNHMDEYSWFLRVTYWPERTDISVN